MSTHVAILTVESRRLDCISRDRPTQQRSTFDQTVGRITAEVTYEVTDAVIQSVRNANNA